MPFQCDLHGVSSGSPRFFPDFSGFLRKGRSTWGFVAESPRRPICGKGDLHGVSCFGLSFDTVFALIVTWVPSPTAPGRSGRGFIPRRTEPRYGRGERRLRAIFRPYRIGASPRYGRGEPRKRDVEKVPKRAHTGRSEANRP